MDDGPNPLTWDAQLLSYWFNCNPVVFQDKLMNLMNNLQGGHCFGSSRIRCITGGKITTFKLVHPVFDSGIRWCMSRNVCVRMAWIFFHTLPCRKKKLMTTRVTMLLKLRMLPDMLAFGLCNKKRLAIWHMNRPLFPTTLSIPSYDIGKYVGLRTYQHPLLVEVRFGDVCGLSFFLLFIYCNWVVTGGIGYFTLFRWVSFMPI